MSISEKLKSGFKVKRINGLLMILTSLLCVVVLILTFSTKTKYDNVLSAITDYTECNKAITELQSASDFLTNQSRLFIVNQDTVFLNNYFEEVNNLKRRNAAIDIVEMSHIGDEPDVNIKMAFRESEYLSQIEMYSMKLVCLAKNMPANSIPQQLQEIQITAADELLPTLDKIERARHLLFDQAYISSKDRISKYCSVANSTLITSFLKLQFTEDESFTKYFTVIRIGLVALFFVNIILYVVLIFLILHPLYKHNQSIKVGKRMKNIGSYEIRYIAKTYNELIEKNEIKASILRHKAEHDTLTGLINREAFNQIKTILSDSSETIAYLLIDIDLFKSINDTYGHQTGDQVLKKIASLLLEQFRNTDYVARIGGDEFAVIMTKFGSSPEQIIQSKIENMNKILQQRTDGLPSVSLSVGVAFSYCGYIDELESQADTALYNVKKGGRCNCSFYEYTTTHANGEKKE